jgi:tetratricopeptide (TPR) repeat protein
MAFTGRSAEVERLASAVLSSFQGETGLVLVTGEPGIGKSTLVERTLERIDCTVARGSCLPEGGLEYAPFAEALREIDLERTIRYSPDPDLQALLVTDSSGILLAWAGREMTVDPDIFTSMLSAVGMFVADSLAPVSTGGEYLRELKYGDYTLFITAGEGFTLVAIMKGHASEYLVTDLEDLLSRIEDTHSHVLEAWNGDMDKMKGVESMLERFIEESGERTYSLDQKHRAEWIHTNVMRGLERYLRGGRPLAVVLEDIHWMDEASVALLHHLIRGLRSLPVCFVATARSDELPRNAAVMQLLNHLKREEAVETLHLGPLSADSTRAILEEILDGGVDPAIVDLVHGRAEGVPLYVEEMARLLSRMPPGESPDMIPPTMEGVVLRRLEFVENRELLEVCSVCGYEIDVQAVAEVMGMRRLGVLRALRKVAEETGLVEMHREGVRFHHRFERDVVYGSIPPPLREEYEVVFGEYYEEKGDFYRAAIHYHKGGDAERARECALRAASALEGEFAYPSALHMYRMAADLSEGEERARLLARAGRLCMVIGRWDEAHEMFQEALKMGESADALVGLGNLLLREGRTEEAAEAFRGALSAPSFSESEKIRAKYGLAVCSVRMGDVEGAERLMEEYLEEVSGRGWKRAVAEALMGMGGLRWYAGDLDGAREYYEKALRISEEERMLDLVGEINHNLCVVLGRLGMYEEAVKRGERSVEIKEKIGAISEIGTTHNSIGRIHFSRGQMEEAESHYRKALGYARKVGDARLEGISLSNLGILHYYLGRFDEALKCLREALQPLTRTGDRFAETEARLYIATILGIQGDVKGASEELSAVERFLMDLRREDLETWFTIVSTFIAARKKSDYGHLLYMADYFRREGKFLYAGITYHLHHIATGNGDSRQRALEMYERDDFLAPVALLRR